MRAKSYIYFVKIISDKYNELFAFRRDSRHFINTYNFT